MERIELSEGGTSGTYVTGASVAIMAIVVSLEQKGFCQKQA